MSLARGAWGRSTARTTQQEDFLSAECAAGPVVIVIEDLQWRDLSSVEFVDAALRTQHERPLMVLATARPEVLELFPGLWADRALQTIRLGELSRREAIAALRAFHLVRAGKITDPAVRCRYLEDVPEHARALRRAAEWLPD